MDNATKDRIRAINVLNEVERAVNSVRGARDKEVALYKIREAVEEYFRLKELNEKA